MSMRLHMRMSIVSTSHISVRVGAEARADDQVVYDRPFDPDRHQSPVIGELNMTGRSRRCPRTRSDQIRIKVG